MAKKKSSDIPKEITIKVPEGQTTADVELPHITYETETEQQPDGVDVVIKRKVEYKKTKINLPTKGKRPDEEGQIPDNGQAASTGRGKRSKQFEKARKQKKNTDSVLPKKRMSVKDSEKWLDENGMSGLSKLSENDLRKIASPMRDAANKNLKRLEKSGLSQYSAAYKKRHGKRFSLKGKNRNQLIKEIRDMSDFRNMKTSSPSKVKKGFNKIADVFGLDKKAYEDIKKFMGKAFEIFDEVIANNDSYFAEMYGYKDYVNKAFNMLKDNKSETAVKGYISRLYHAKKAAGTRETQFKMRGV